MEEVDGYDLPQLGISAEYLLVYLSVKSTPYIKEGAVFMVSMFTWPLWSHLVGVM